MGSVQLVYQSVSAKNSNLGVNGSRSGGLENQNHELKEAEVTRRELRGIAELSDEFLWLCHNKQHLLHYTLSFDPLLIYKH